MFSSLKNHPFDVEAFFKSSVVITFALKTEKLQPFIPACCSLDTFKDKWAFLAVAMVDTSDLRPKGFPAFTGNNFFLIGYRIFVHYQSNSGKRFRGLYILKSETDRRHMEWLGNIFTHYNYTTTDIVRSSSENFTNIQSAHSAFNIDFISGTDDITLPQGSPFANWKEARNFAGPLPFTFTFNKKANEVLIIEGVRQNWVPQPLKVLNYNFSFLDSFGLKDAILANAFIINNVPYYWKKGRKEIWKG